MSEKKAVLSLGTIIILLSVLAFSVKASSVEVIQIDALTEKTLTFNLSSGRTFSGSLAISGSLGDNAIDFWVSDPQGTKIVDLGRVTQGKTFEFTAQASGAYTLHFGNTFSLWIGKTVNLTYDVGLPTVLGIDLGTLLLIIIGVAVFLLLVVLGLAVVRYRKKNLSKTNQPPPPSTPSQPSSTQKRL